MTQEVEDQFKKKIFDAGYFFSPSAPINSKSLFSGRSNQLTRVIDLIFTRGQHGIIYGERGVGKTSLANILHEVLTPTEPDSKFCVAKVNCDATDNFTSVWVKAFERVRFALKQPSIGFSPNDESKIVSLTDIVCKQNQIKPDDIRRLEELSHNRFIFIFDEFDRLSAEGASGFFADTIKTLSDYTRNVTIILIGVADSVNELIKEHASIDRSLVQILMPRMTANEIKAIIDSTLDKLGMTIDENAKETIVNLSQGLPHYTHLIGLWTARNALNDFRLNIGLNDVHEGIRMSLQNAQQSIIAAYNKAIQSHRKDSLFKEVLLACALCPLDELGYFAPVEVKHQLEKILAHTVEIAAFSRHLSEFISDKRGILQRTGEKRRFRFRFTNPLIQPFVVMRGIDEKLITPQTMQMAD